MLGCTVTHMYTSAFISIAVKRCLASSAAPTVSYALVKCSAMLECVPRRAACVWVCERQRNILSSVFERRIGSWICKSPDFLRSLRLAMKCTRCINSRILPWHKNAAGAQLHALLALALAFCQVTHWSGALMSPVLFFSFRNICVFRFRVYCGSVFKTVNKTHRSALYTLSDVGFYSIKLMRWSINQPILSQSEMISYTIIGKHL